jgi:hypothetical protein
MNMSEAELERKSLQDLKKIIEEAKKWQIRLIIIEGYAVRAYTKGYRFTKDIDLVTTKKSLGKLKALLQYLGYKCRNTEFGIAGSKKFNEGFIDLHISVESILDISTGISIPVTENLFKEAIELQIKGYYPESKDFAFTTKVISLELLMLLKLIPVGREKDLLDVFALLIDKGKEANLNKISEKCKQYKLRDHLLSQLRKYADLIRKGEMRKIWFNITGLRLTQVEEREALKFIRKLIETLRQ